LHFVLVLQRDGRRPLYVERREARVHDALFRRQKRGGIKREAMAKISTETAAATKNATLPLADTVIVRNVNRSSLGVSGIGTHSSIKNRRCLTGGMGGHSDRERKNFLGRKAAG
jgi:hypothetical protein